MAVEVPETAKEQILEAVELAAVETGEDITEAEHQELVTLVEAVEAGLPTERPTPALTEAQAS